MFAMRGALATLLMLGSVSTLGVAPASESEAQTVTTRRNERPLVPRSQGRRQADRAAQQASPRVYVPGHWAWDSRRGQYSWVTGRWERYDPNQAFVGGGLQFRNGQWTLGPNR